MKSVQDYRKLSENNQLKSVFDTFCTCKLFSGVRGQSKLEMKPLPVVGLVTV